MRENTYVRVHGHVRAFQDKRNVAAFRVLPLTDMNELTTHMLEVVHCHLYLTKSQKGVSTKPLVYCCISVLHYSLDWK